MNGKKLFVLNISIIKIDFLYSTLLLAKMCLFVFGVTFAASRCQFFAYVAASFVTSLCRFLSVRGREGRASGSNSRGRWFEENT